MTPPVVRALDRLQWGFAVAIAATFVALVAVAATPLDGTVLPAWFGMAGTLVAGVASLFVVRYYRRRPLEGIRDYTSTVSLRMGVSLVPSLLALPLSLASGEVLVQALGLGFTLVAASWSVPGLSDFERHRRLATDTGPPPPAGAWGAARPDEHAPWDDEHGGHGHGPGH